METIKSHSDLEQSKKLAEILPLESADMCFANDGTAIKIDANSYNVRKQMWKNCVVEIIPCWSLAALLDVLPNNENISTNLSKGGYRISTLEYTNSWFVDYEDETDGLNNCVTSADNPVDACVAMVEKLHGLNLL